MVIVTSINRTYHFLSIQVRFRDEMMMMMMSKIEMGRKINYDRIT